MSKLKHLPFEALRPVVKNLVPTKMDGYTKPCIKVYYEKSTVWPEAQDLHRSEQGAPLEYFEIDEDFQRIRESPDPSIRRLYKRHEFTEDAQVLLRKKEEGVIKTLTDKGFGFIMTEKGKDLFFHASTVQGVSFVELQVGQKVSYTEGRGPKGPCAENVTLA